MSSDVLWMGRRELLSLTPEDVSQPLTGYELVHIATILNAFWAYDYVAAQESRVGMHALLRSGLHSDGFFVSRILFEAKNILEIISHQMVMRMRNVGVSLPDYVVGVPNGATALGLGIAKILGTQEIYMEKIGNEITLTMDIPDGATVLVVEDFSTSGSGFAEAVWGIRNKHPLVKLVPYVPVIINRNGKIGIDIENIGRFQILPLVERRIRGWTADDCPLCDLGSVAIKPKATDRNWYALLASQL